MDEAEADEEDGGFWARGRKLGVLCPVADMLNHVAEADGATTEWGCERATGDFVVRSRRAIGPDEVG